MRLTVRIALPMDNPEEVTEKQLQEILADFSALGRATYLDDPALGFDYASAELDELGLPRFSPDVPRVPVALVERHQEMWTHPDNPGPRQEIWTEQALSQGMGRIGTGVQRLPSLDGWLIAEWPEDGGGLQLQQPDRTLFVYALCEVDEAWTEAARKYGEVLVLHGPRLGLRVQPGRTARADHERRAELADARRDGLVTGGLMRWGRVKPS
jgi:hypothetical protein